MRRQYSGGAKPTTLSSSLGGSNTDLIVSGTDFTNYPDGSVGPFYIVIDRGQVSEEKILCSSRTGNTINVYNVGLTNGRGADGTSVVAHSSGGTVEHVFTAADADESNLHVNTSTGTVHGLVLSNVATLSDLNFKADKNFSFSTKTSNYTLQLTGVGTGVEMNVTSESSRTIPANSSVAFPIGTAIIVIQTGIIPPFGRLSVVAASGVTVNATPGLYFRSLWSVATLIKRGTDTWIVTGDLTS